MDEDDDDDDDEEEEDLGPDDNLPAALAPASFGDWRAGGGFFFPGSDVTVTGVSSKSKSSSKFSSWGLIVLRPETTEGALPCVAETAGVL